MSDNAKSSPDLFASIPIPEDIRAILAPEKVVRKRWKQGKWEIRYSTGGRVHYDHRTMAVNIRPLNKTQLSALKVAMSYIEAEGEIRFVPVGENESADIRIASAAFIGEKQQAGAFTAPIGAGDKDILIRSDYTSEGGMQVMFQHEIGHALGLKHPYATSLGRQEGGYDPRFNNEITRMSYLNCAHPEHYMLLGSMDKKGYRFLYQPPVNSMHPSGLPPELKAPASVRRMP